MFMFQLQVVNDAIDYINQLHSTIIARIRAGNLSPGKLSVFFLFQILRFLLCFFSFVQLVTKNYRDFSFAVRAQYLRVRVGNRTILTEFTRPEFLTVFLRYLTVHSSLFIPPSPFRSRGSHPPAVPTESTTPGNHLPARAPESLALPFQRQCLVVQLDQNCRT